MYLGPVREEHAPLCCPFTPQIWAAQLLLNVYSSGNWLHPVKVQVTSFPLLGCCCCSSTTLVTFLFHTVHPNLDNISVTLQVWSEGGKWSFKAPMWAACVFSGTGVVLPAKKKKGAKSHSHSSLSPHAQCVLHTSSFRIKAVPQSPSLLNNSCVISMKLQNLDKQNYRAIYLIRTKIALFIPPLQQVHNNGGTKMMREITSAEWRAEDIFQM